MTDRRPPSGLTQILEELLGQAAAIEMVMIEHLQDNSDLIEGGVTDQVVSEVTADLPGRLGLACVDALIRMLGDSRLSDAPSNDDDSGGVSLDYLPADWLERLVDSLTDPPPEC